MIQFLADGIDQLDLALDQLAVRERNFDRFALMLVDNVVELTLHRFAQDRASENELWTKLTQPKHDPKKVERALGQRFDAKVKLAADLDLLPRSAADSILNLHSFRNTAYHRGLRHERILHSLTLFYFRTACALLENYRPRSWYWSSADTLSHRARKRERTRDRAPAELLCLIATKGLKMGPLPRLGTLVSAAGRCIR